MRCDIGVAVCQACVLSLLALLAPPARGEAALTLVEDGRPLAAIVVPAEPNGGERRAAEELQTYVKKASGAKLPIRTGGDAGSGVRILLGRACRNLDTPPSGDGFTIQSVDGAILIAGGNPRGTLYGVYAFLEDQLGVRWYMPDRIGEVVPEARSIRIPPIHRHEEPDFEYRWIGRGDDWSARNRNNVGLPEIGVNIFRSAHTFRTFLDPAEYFDEHPEWFAMVGGRRKRYESTTHNNQICTSNPAAVAEVIKNMRAFLDQHPETDIVTLFPNDGNGFCECENCKALDEPGWATVEEVNRVARAAGLRGYGTLSRRLMIFNNTVARAIHETHPRVIVKVGAYSCYTNPPKDASLKYEPNVIVQICHSWCQNHAIADPSCPINADFKRAIEGWSRITPGGVMLYEYYYKVAQCELPYPIIHSMRQDFPYFKSIGVKGVYTQYAANWGTLALDYYLPSRLLWDCHADVDRILDQFYRDFYGPAAAPMKRYYGRLEKAAIDSGLHFSPPYYRFPEVFTAACLADCRACLDEALRLADSQTVRARLAMAQTSLAYTGLVVDYVNAVRAVDAAERPRWQLDMPEDVFAEAREKAKAVRQFMARPETKDVLKPGSNYVDRLLNPLYTFEFRWDRTDPKQLELKNEIALTRPDWLETVLGGSASSGLSVLSKKPGPLPETFDLWIYGYDFDADSDKPEHDLCFLDEAGNRVASYPLPPKGQTSNRATGCVVYKGLPWPDNRRDVLRLEVVNRPGDWSSSTLLAVYVLPGGHAVSAKRAADLIRSQPDWPRQNSMGFVEFGFRGLTNDESQPTRIDVQLAGPPAKRVESP